MFKATCHFVLTHYFAVEDKKTSPLLDNLSSCIRLQTPQDCDKTDLVKIRNNCNVFIVKVFFPTVNVSNIKIMKCLVVPVILTRSSFHLLYCAGTDLSSVL